MTIVRSILLVAAITSWPVSPCAAQEGEPEQPPGNREAGNTEPAERTATHRRWALGWDGGIGMRYRFDGPWGVGASFDPMWDDRDSEGEGYSSSDRYESSSIAIGEGVNRSNSFAVSGFMFREVRIGRWLGVGPFLGTSYGYSYSTSESLTRSSETSQQQPPAVETRLYQEGYERRTWSVFAGIRPTFTFDERFVLESRFGVTLSHSSWERTYLSRETHHAAGETSVSTWGDRSSNSGWSIDVFGRELGPGSVLSFMVYF